MANPFRHREVSACDILNMSLDECRDKEFLVKHDLEAFER